MEEPQRPRGKDFQPKPAKTVQKLSPRERSKEQNWNKDRERLEPVLSTEGKAIAACVRSPSTPILTQPRNSWERRQVNEMRAPEPEEDRRRRRFHKQGNPEVRGTNWSTSNRSRPQDNEQSLLNFCKWKSRANWSLWEKFQRVSMLHRRWKRLIYQRSRNEGGNNGKINIKYPGIQSSSSTTETVVIS